MWNIVIASGSTPGGHTQWPVIETERQWNDRITNRRDPTPAPTEGVSTETLEAIRNLQPLIAGGKLRTNQPLMKLLRISNEDKHRGMHVAAAIPVSFSGPTFDPIGYLSFTKINYPAKSSPIQEGAEFCRVKVRRVSWPPPEGVQVKVKMAPEGTGVHMAFYKADGTFVAALDDLRPIIDAARNAIKVCYALPIF